MEIYADFRQKVEIEPKDVIEQLIEEEIGWHNWIFEKDGKFYVGMEFKSQTFFIGQDYEVIHEIDEEKYRYVEALQLVLKQLT